MTGFRLSRDGAGKSRIAALTLPFLHFGATATEEEQAAAPDPRLAGAIGPVRTHRYADGTSESLVDSPRRLLLVVSGAVRIDAPDMRAVARPGDVVLVDATGEQDLTARFVGETRLIEVEVTGEWQAGSVMPELLEARRGPRNAPTIAEMYVADDRANLRDLDRLFPATPGDSPGQDALALSWMCLSPGSFGDWHTEPSPSLVFVLSGGFELEVGGSGGKRVLHAGDVCLVRDDHGQGHRSRTHGETRFAAIRLPDDHQWA
ncbi:cupin domain-containing protein [Amycolatopsis sp. GM8]|uniref:cupin domain-containing protein n=1 Tax=Amycolatopsis sp. GM8 TaxID=2896530 RepID=UPI001F1AE320|nr:cupin domain-containing protein [Amycolatopsis sp. GM8]